MSEGAGDWSHVPARFAELGRQVGAAAERAGRAGERIRLVAVTKTVPPEALRAAYEAGHREFGENRVQDALSKIEALPADVVWHMVGHLQTNKVNKVLGRFDLIHSVDSWRLAERLSEKSLARDLRSAVLVEVNCSGDESKQGLEPDEAEDFVLSLAGLGGIVVQGLMTIGPLHGGAEGAREAFGLLRGIRDRLRQKDRPELPLTELSMGMSEDYEIAVEEGATILRVGRALFTP
jgi:pyridoxal phosphate enzyme (YggS family)